MDEQLVQEVEMLYSQVCQGLGDPKRLLILYALSRGPQYVSELAKELDVPQPTVSRHLKILRERGLVEARRESAIVYYTIADNRIIQALDLMRAMLRDRMTHNANLAEFRALDNSRTSSS
jgi:ArsR family transcriptional regulator